MVSPAKKLKSAVRPFISAVAASTASRRGLAAAPSPSFAPPSSAWHLASSKSKQSAAKLLTAKYRNFFECDAEPHELANSTVAHLKELSDQLGATSLWATGINHVTTEAARVFFGRWESRMAYANVRIDKDTWLVMSPPPRQRLPSVGMLRLGP